MFEIFSERLEQVLRLTIHSSRHQVQWTDCSSQFQFPCAGVEIKLIYPQDESVLSVTVTGDLQIK